MPGTVVAVAVADGDRVAAGDPLLSVEAMKMEHQLRAPVAGTVSLGLRPGDLVKADQVLATVTPDINPSEPDPADPDPSDSTPGIPAPAGSDSTEGADHARL